MNAAPDQDQKNAIKAVGTRLKMAREAAGIDAITAGRSIGRSPESIRAYERGSIVIATWQLQALATAYGVEVSWLMTGEGSPPSPTVVRGPRYPQPPLDIDPVEAAGLRAYPGLPVRPANAPRRYRLVCPSCGKPWAPEDLGRHLMLGDSCSRTHGYEEAERLLAEAHRDPLPWLQALEKGRQRIEHFQQLMESAPDEVRRDVYRISLQLYRHWLLQIETLGPDKYEWTEE